MIVIFDTTEFYTNLRLEGPNYMLLRTYLNKTSTIFVVPKIVFEETVNHFRERLLKHSKEVKDGLNNLSKLIAVTGYNFNPNLNQEEAVEKYRRELDSLILQMNGKVIGYEKVDVDKLVKRSLERRKPFDGDGKIGFRDAVLWETLLQELHGKDPNTTVYLISKNSKDFGTEEQLFKPLQLECVGVGMKETCVRLFNGLQSFIDSVVKPHLDTLDEIQDRLKQGEYKGFVLDVFFTSASESIMDYIQNYLKQYGFQRHSGHLIRLVHSPELLSMDSKPREVSIEDVWSIDHDKVAVGIKVCLGGKIKYYEQHEILYPCNDEVFSDIFDECFVGEATFLVSLTVVLNRNTGSTDIYEIDKIEVQLAS
ncbi:hypothetical protein FGO68_gene15040 [Halteria grandinella]|uniref:DUF4935 domain-containing protein n=1 Tax=Halteria grandinella TaxID=5974 RepID=A0A8J8NAX4_HALGN|nr:hypothetical protein FGO68_gene15040 [Halteria grandinella]